MDGKQTAQFAARLVIAMTLGIGMDAAAAHSRDGSGQASSPVASALPQSVHGNQTIASRPAPADLVSRSAFDAWCARHPNAPTPLDALSPGGRERFIDSLDFTAGGIGGVGTDDLGRELTQPQIDRLLAWLGLSPGLARSMIDGDAASSSTAKRGAPVFNPSITPTERRVTDFLRRARATGVEQTPAQRAARTARLYDAMFPRAMEAAALRDLSDADILLLQLAALQASYDAHHPPAIDAMQALLPVLQARGIMVDRDLADLQNALLSARRFDAARALQTAHPRAALDTIPRLRDTVATLKTAPTVWRVDDDGAVLERDIIDLRGTRIVVTAGCHLSQDAAVDIASDPVLGSVFARHATWLMAPPGQESIDAVLDWNRRFPQSQAVMRHDDAEWSLLPSFATPNFYVIRDGRVIERVTGWSSRTKEQRQPLIDALSRSGLLAD